MRGDGHVEGFCDFEVGVGGYRDCGQERRFLRVGSDLGRW